MKQIVLLAGVMAVACAGLFGCASTEPVLAPVAPERTYVAGLMNENPGKAIVTFYRKGRFRGSVLNTSVFINGKEVADLDNGTYIVVALDPGTYVVYSDAEEDAVDIRVEADKEYYFLIELEAGLWKGHGVLRSMTEMQGRSQFERMREDLKPAKDVRIPEMVISGRATAYSGR